MLCRAVLSDLRNMPLLLETQRTSKPSAARRRPTSAHARQTNHPVYMWVKYVDLQP